LKLDALFFGTHPDDVEITCGGTVILLSRNGKKTGIIDLTKGELSTRGNLKIRQEETKSASRILGIKYRSNLGLKDGNIVNNAQSRIKIIKLLRQLKPQIIFAPYPDDRHPDHINSSSLIRESAFYSGLGKIKTGILNPFRPSRIFYYRHSHDIPVSFIVDISSTFELKMKAIKAYKTQFYSPDLKEPETYISSKLFIENIETRAKYFGFKIGVKYGEPFYSIENIKINVENIFKI
jgi:bacillithiol biosynthesis deacetylase BshB1